MEDCTYVWSVMSMWKTSGEPTLTNISPHDNCPLDILFHNVWTRSQFAPWYSHQRNICVMSISPLDNLFYCIFAPWISWCIIISPDGFLVQWELPFINISSREYLAPFNSVLWIFCSTLLSKSEIYNPRNALAPTSLLNLKYKFLKQNYKICKK
jgi:hypothetical protein